MSIPESLIVRVSPFFVHILFIGTALFANLDKFKDAPAPPIDQATLKKETDTLVSVNAAAENGGKKELAQQKHQKEVVVKLIILLAHWVEANCKDDMTIFLSTGLQGRRFYKGQDSAGIGVDT